MECIQNERDFKHRVRMPRRSLAARAWIPALSPSHPLCGVWMQISYIQARWLDDRAAADDTSRAAVFAMTKLSSCPVVVAGMNRLPTMGLEHANVSCPQRII